MQERVLCIQLLVTVRTILKLVYDITCLFFARLMILENSQKKFLNGLA